MEEDELLGEICTAAETFGAKCTKFGGAVTVEVLRRFLIRHRIPVSCRDVYIRGLPIEIDLLIPAKDAVPAYGILYEPQQVRCVLEVKKLGSFGEPTVKTVRVSFERIARLGGAIRCAYVTLEERKGYRFAITQETIGFPCFTLFWHWGSSKSLQRETSGDWKRLVEFLQEFI